ncbi:MULTISPECIES: cell division protein FtsQ/DivIB [Zymobacter]|uniref:Cell division protein FtsQ n=1 Tax=Zymobacter palmae TaxID=33074 RepID=A0A348HDH7_9GAMM|nr:cell division protein FtsQ/DivIB [Zymobacter palmae]BBG29679.1 cell division protein FtsQ [Zymobacter palmae]
MAGRLTNRMFGLVLVLALLVAGGRSLWLWLDQPVRHLDVRDDAHRVSGQQLQQRIAPLVKGSGWLSVDLQALRAEVRQVPWVHEVSISRRWPDTLRFDIQEQQPVAWWNDSRLLNAQGEVFEPGQQKITERMPNLSGPDERAADVLAYYNRLQSVLAKKQLTITQLTLEPRGAWRFQVDDSFWVLMGRSQVEPQREPRLARFLTAWDRMLSGRRDQIRYLDLRYPNGLAIGWHGQTATGNVSSR